MLCSFPTTAKSSASSKWLHRLRSSKGFPDSDHINLEHFLSDSLHKIDPPIYTDSALPHLDGNSMTDQRHDNGAIQGGDVINNVLSELFHMGDFQDLSRTKRKKSCRKQLCPRICVISKNSDVDKVPLPKDKVSSPLPLTLNNRRKVKEVSQELKVRERVEEEEERGHWDPSAAYSQTEVTVIDTSVPSWKFEKMLFRRKNVWKVGDKKGKGLMTGDKKKRKASLNENGDGEKKKLKLCSSSSKSGNGKEGGEKKKKKRFKACNSSKYVDKEEAMVRSKPPQGLEQGKRMVAAYEKKEEAQEKSFLKKQIDGGGSSVILIKSIPATTTSKKDVPGISKSFVKPMHK